MIGKDPRLEKRQSWHPFILLKNPLPFRHRLIVLVLPVGFILCSAFLAVAQTISYTIDLTHPESHLAAVTMTVPDARAATEIQFPAWNALYQIRDFVRNVQDLRATCNGAPLALQPVDLYTFRTGAEACSPLEVRYQVFIHERGVFSSDLISGHAFLNLAELLFYVPGQRVNPDRVRFIIPPSWKLVTFLPWDAARGGFSAPDYDALVDSPVEAGSFAFYSYSQGGALYRIVVRGDRSDYPASRLIETIKKITAAETLLMRSRPFSRYTFIFHFPDSGGGGGMEHRDGAAISFPAPLLGTDWEGLENTIAHEYFHLWNVKRIRPGGLVPVDYIHGNDTRDLWFSEGVTSAYAELVLLRAGLITRTEFYAHAARGIERLEQRPARHFQSVELAGIDAWLEKYPDYFRPGRSISYYNKGELLGDLLDLEICHRSAGVHSLDDLMRILNERFAQEGRPFDDHDLENIVASLGPSSAWVHNFFKRDVDGTKSLDYQKYLGYAGLELVSSASRKPDWGFTAATGFTGVIRVTSVNPSSAAAHAGIEAGDVLESVNGQTLYALPQDVTGLKSGQRVRLRMERGSRTLTLKFRLGSRTETHYQIEENPDATLEEIAIRTSWLSGATPAEEAAGKQ